MPYVLKIREQKQVIGSYVAVCRKTHRNSRKQCELVSKRANLWTYTLKLFERAYTVVISKVFWCK